VRPITLFSGQWTDLPLETLAEKAGAWGYDGLELACAPGHFDVSRTLADPQYVDDQRELLARHGLGCWAIGAHMVGQAICDPLDARHQAILPPEIWGDGDPGGVRARATQRMKDTARAAAAFEVAVVTGFTGSGNWRYLYPFPPTHPDEVERGYGEFAERWSPIIDVFEAEGVRFALEVHPGEIAYDFVTTSRALQAIGRRPGFGLNLDPSHFVPQFLDPAKFAFEFRDQIAHVHIKDAKRRLDGRRSILGSHLPFADPDRGWTFVSPGHGDVDFDELVRALNAIGYTGPLSTEWEDSGMDRDWGAAEAVQYIRRFGFESPAVPFDAPFSR